MPRPEGPQPDFVNPKDIRCESYRKLEDKIELAASLGIPVLPEGTRGTGKTSLAQRYHERLVYYRSVRPDAHGRNCKRPVNAPKEVPQRPVSVTLSEYADVNYLRDFLLGWAEGSFTGCKQAWHGYIGEADNGTLFLDEIHHLDKSLQAGLLGALNSGRYRPKGASEDVESHFGLVTATNVKDWREELSPDFRDRITRIVLHVPSFQEIRGEKDGMDDIMTFWNFVLSQHCLASGISCPEPSPECRQHLTHVLHNQPLNGNWRDLHRLADHVLMEMVRPRGGRPTDFEWDPQKLELAVRSAFDED